MKIIEMENHFKLELKSKNKARAYKTRAKSSYGTCDEARGTNSQEIMWYEL